MKTPQSGDPSAENVVNILRRAFEAPPIAGDTAVLADFVEQLRIFSSIVKRKDKLAKHVPGGMNPQGQTKSQNKGKSRLRAVGNKPPAQQKHQTVKPTDILIREIESRIRRRVRTSAVVHVGVFGQMKAGKTTLINELCSIDLPTGRTMATAIPTAITAGDRENVRFETRTRTAFDGKMDDIQIVRHWTKTDGFPWGRVFRRILLRTRDFPFKNLTLIDLPGYSGGNWDGHGDAAIAEEEAFDCDVVLYVANSTNNQISSVDMKYLTQLLSRGIRCAVFVNTWDSKMPPDDYNQVVIHIEEMLSKIRKGDGQLSLLTKTWLKRPNLLDIVKAFLSQCAKDSPNIQREIESLVNSEIETLRSMIKKFKIIKHRTSCKELLDELKALKNVIGKAWMSLDDAIAKGEFV
jgi:hypothetical protein